MDISSNVLARLYTCPKKRQHVVYVCSDKMVKDSLGKLRVQYDVKMNVRIGSIDMHHVSHVQSDVWLPLKVRIHFVSLQTSETEACQKILMQALPVYRRLNKRFLSCCGCPSHPVVGSRSFAYFLMSPQRTDFIGPKGCPCASNSTRFFMAVLPPAFRVGCGCDVSIASLFSWSESSSVPEWVAYPRLRQQHPTIY